MSGLDGGITMKQYKTIQQMADVEVAAPIAMIGNSNILCGCPALVHSISKKKACIKYHGRDEQDTGLLKSNNSPVFVFPSAGWNPSGRDGMNRDISRKP